MANSNNTTHPSSKATTGNQEKLAAALAIAVDCGTVGTEYIGKHCLPVLRSIVELSDVANLSPEAIASRMCSIAGIARLGVHLADVAENDMECWREKAQDELGALRAVAA